ncbi:hypothetical protein VB715_00010 [Crocosphaera sp. UHCC 0190]|uniref:hypothetical protein n=1 Tax=Crocosphaera sp. UHCC 0190 TaxID=3110246 RepID=UPI002B1F7481|nr:hypothetical protein [Crocosphaera sp. UHCC 0190]MEA5508136.1 hypothetical protein [Crocosphaera sp. UHCC 0190]
MAKQTQQLQSFWRKRLVKELPQYNRNQRHGIVSWLLNYNLSFTTTQELSVDELTTLNQKIEYRYSLLRRRYLTVNYTEGYRTLISRLSSVTAKYCSVLRMKCCQKSQREIVNLIQQVIQTLMNHDPYLKAQFEQISQEISDRQLREALVLATVEEYCLHPVKNKPFFLHCLRQHLSQTPLTLAENLMNSSCLNEANNFSYLVEKVAVFG